ncbi:MAG TPA: VTT domain-containing protein [Blastocatellia bacterium]|nr:VTT domain-containing protein [Blastocatellia bacterium]
MSETGLALLTGIGKALERLLEWLLAYGWLGVFGISLVDSIGVPLPGGPDAAVILLSSNAHAMMPVYALAATIGSTIGCTVLYLAARRAGSAALRRVTPQRRERIENLLGRYDMIAVMVPAVLPPPFPFKPFVLSAGVFKLKVTRFIVAIFIGRSARFLIEGWLAIRFGQEAGSIIKRNGLTVLALVGIISVAALALKLYLARRSPTGAINEVQPPN